MSDADKHAELPQLKEMAEGIVEHAECCIECCFGTYEGFRSDDLRQYVFARLAPLYAELDREKGQNGQLRAANAKLLAENERLRAEIAELRQPMTNEARVQTSELKPDWRIGLTVKAKYRSDPLYYERGKVVDVHGSGFCGIDDKDGVLRIKLDSGNVILSASDKWVTA